ncbi:hypothetical protein B9C88_01305 [Brevibacillus laterosporus]|nr:hypothetical protein B9C88_01305 [Brevibacillus laterosporus]
MNQDRLGIIWAIMNVVTRYEHGFPNAWFSEQYQDGSGANGSIQEDELIKKYNIRLIVGIIPNQ